MSPGRIMATVSSQGLPGVQPMARRRSSGAPPRGPARRPKGAGSRKAGSSTRRWGRATRGSSPSPVGRVDDEDPRRRPQRRGGGVMAQGIGAAGALAGERGLGDQIGDGRAPWRRRAHPVRRLVIEVIGEPGGRALGRRAGGIVGAAGARRWRAAGGRARSCWRAGRPRRHGLRSRLASSTRWPACSQAWISSRAMRRSPEGTGWSGGFSGA